MRDAGSNTAPLADDAAAAGAVAAVDVVLPALAAELAGAPNSDVEAAALVVGADELKLNAGAAEAEEAAADGAVAKLPPNEKPLLVAGAEDEDELVTVDVAAVAADGKLKEKDDGAVDEGAAEADSDDDEDDELRLGTERQTA